MGIVDFQQELALDLQVVFAVGKLRLELGLLVYRTFAFLDLSVRLELLTCLKYGIL